MKLTLFSTLILLLSALSNPGHADPQLWSKSYALEKEGNYTEAADAIFPFLEEPQNAEFTLMRLAWLSYLKGNYSQSTNYYKKALARNRLSIDARTGLLSALAAQNRWKEIALVVDELLSLSPWNLQAHLFLMQLESRRRDWKTLAHHAKSLTFRYPTSADPWVFLARAYHHQRDIPAALTTYQEVLIRYPDNIEANAYINTARR